MALVALAALGVALRAVLPWAIARTIESQGREQLGLPVRLANVDLWLAAGAVALEGLVVGRHADAAGDPGAAPDPDTALFRLPRLYVRLDWGALLARRIHLRELAFEGPKIRIERDADGRIEPLGPPAAPAEPPPEPAPEAGPEAEPWTVAIDRLDLRELDVRLADLATRHTPVEFALTSFSLADVAVAGGALDLGSVEIGSPVLRVDRDFSLGGGSGGGPGPSGDPAPAAEGSGESAALAYQIERIEIADAGFTLRTDSGPLDLAIALRAERVNAREGELFPIDLALGIEDGKLALQGELGLNPVAYRGRLGWSGLGLPPLAVAARPELAEWVRSCRADGEVTVALNAAPAADAAPGLHISGAATVRDLLLADPSGEEVSVGWKELEIVVREAFVPFTAEGEAPRAPRVSLERVRLVDPDLLYTRPAPALDRLLGAGAQAPATGGAEAADEAAALPVAPPLELVVDAFDLERGRVRFVDRTPSRPVETRLRDLSVAVRDAGLPDPHARSVRSTGIVPERASFSLDGGLEKGSGELRLSLERLALAPFDPYAAAAGYELTSGEASLETKLRLRGERTEADNRLVLHRLDLSSRDPGAFEKRFGMPLDVALALLRDPSGDISLAIPVVVDESGARTGLATIVQGALRQALVGALSSPLKLVGAVLPTSGGREASFAPLDALPGLAELAPGSDERLRALARLLAARPALGLRLRGRSGPADRPVVAEQILVERATAGEALPEVEGSGFFARRRIAQALEARGRGEEGPLEPEDRALLLRMVASVDVPPARLDELARRRAEAVRDALATAHDVDARRLPVGEPAPAGEPAVELELAATGS